MTQLKDQTALITGATAGIGLATAEALAERGCKLILTGRRADRLETIAKQLKAQPLIFDISNREQTERALKEADLKHLTILINNAGLALGTESLSKANLDDLDKMIDTNVKGLLHVTRLTLPHLIANRDSHIVNIGSVAGRYVYPGGATYCATKFAVRALTEGLRMDLMGTPVRVTNIEPGMVETEFSEVRLKDKDKAKAVYQGLKPLEPKDLADAIVWTLDRPAHVNVQEMMIYPTAQAGVGPSYTTRS